MTDNERDNIRAILTHLLSLAEQPRSMTRKLTDIVYGLRAALEVYKK